jgi:phosphate starvation-inducible PhoH-like protein
MASALSSLQNKEVNRIVLTRPAVEAGEKLGFLPGDLQQKINPYLRPLYDALYNLAPSEQATNLLEKGIIEIAPLAFMRGRTLNNAFIILDEAQNTTKEQMKMLLTRTGFDSKLIITADITQIDLPQPHKSGVLQALEILSGIKEIAFIKFNEKDVVRHPLVQKIIKAYEKAVNKPKKKK